MERFENFEVWDAENPVHREAWLQAWESLGAEPFSHPDYVSALAASGHRSRAAWARTHDGGELLYAFHQRPITHVARGWKLPPGWTDTLTPLFYGGLETRDVDPDGEAWFWEMHGRWARNVNIVTEFVRFRPGRAAESITAYPGTLRPQAPHVVRDLRGLDTDAVLAGIPSSVRNKYRKAGRAGYTVEIDHTDAHLDDFVSIYHETMDRVGAADRFRYSRSVFEVLLRAFSGRYTFVFVMGPEGPVAAGLDLHADARTYYFLAGTRTSALRSGVQVLACVTGMQEALARGSEEYVLGGGVSNSVEDTLLDFKRHLAPEGLRDYITGSRVFHTDVYSMLSAGHEDTGDFFPVYRAPLSAPAPTVTPAPSNTPGPIVPESTTTPGAPVILVEPTDASGPVPTEEAGA